MVSFGDVLGQRWIHILLITVVAAELVYLSSNVFMPSYRVEGRFLGRGENEVLLIGENMHIENSRIVYDLYRLEIDMEVPKELIGRQVVVYRRGWSFGIYPVEDKQF